MNFIFLSPHFPPNYYPFSINLRLLGANVFGIADEPHEILRPELREALTEYYWVDDMHDYDSLLRACGYFTHRYGKIDRIDSLNEYWLQTEANLRTDFNVFGLQNKDIAIIKRKSLMKEVFRKAGVQVARGQVIPDLEHAQQLIDEIGYPVVVKPDIGVGAEATYKIHNDQELEEFFSHKPPVDYIMEEFINGQIFSFDGLTNRNGEIEFFTSHEYNQGVMETVNTDDQIYYYSLRDIPEDLEKIGRKVVKAFNVRERFFHLEFFRDTQDGEITALEVNMRPPGGLTTDMFNYANDIDIYKEWANVIVKNRFTANYSRPYHCAYVGRKYNRQYLHGHDELIEAFGQQIVHHETISGVFAQALGNYGYLIRSPELEEIHAMAEYIHAMV